jgi:uncharacterized protein
MGILDMFRGWALIGVVVFNYLIFAKPGASQTLTDGIVFGLAGLVFQTKSWMLLSFLFGYGFSIQMRRGEGEPGMDLFFLRRMGVLLLISFVNILLFSGDILHDYALLGILLLLLSKLPSRIWPWLSGFLLLAPMVVGVLFPGIMSESQEGPQTWSIYLGQDLLAILRSNLRDCWRIFLSVSYGINVHMVMLSMMLLGLYAERHGFFMRLASQSLRKILFWISLGGLLLAVGWLVVGITFLPTSSLGLTSMHLVQGLAGFFFFMCLVRLWHAGKLRTFFTSLTMVGRMTLTNYLLQNMLMIPLFSGVGLGWAQRPLSWPYIALALAIYLAQIRFSKWWLTRYHHGPIEWLWRCLSYGKWFPLHRSDPQKS